METMGHKIKRLRLERKWTQGQLALRAGLSKSHIGVIESRGDGQLRSDTLLKLARAFGKSVEELAGDITIKFDTPEEILERLRLAQPVSIPVYGKFHAGGVHEEPLEYIYWSPNRKTKTKSPGETKDLSFSIDTFFIISLLFLSPS